MDNWKPKDWLGTVEEWREILVLEYVFTWGYDEPGDYERYKELTLKGWYGKFSNI